MRLRNLKIQDAPLMLEWMHDKNVAGFLRDDFFSKSISDAENFIKKSIETNKDIHYAIVSDEDEYMGTVSLKHIENNSAEFAIAVRTKAMGRGYSWFGMEEILTKAFIELQLDAVYWCVSRQNERAIRFYDKHNFHELIDIPSNLLSRYSDLSNLKWYSVLKGDELVVKDYVAGCRIIHIKTVPTIDAGKLSFFEEFRDIPFNIKRIYYVSNVPEGVRRGFHAHKKLKQLLFCPYGRIQLILDNNKDRE